MKIIKIIFFTLLLLPQPLLAKSFTYENAFYDINSQEVNIKISQRGEVDVRERFTLSFPSSNFFWFFDSSLSQFEIEASGERLSKKVYTLSKEGEKIVVRAKADSPAQVWEVSYKVPGGVRPDRGLLDYDHFSLILASEPGVFIQNLSATVYLPAPIESSELKQKIYAIHGVGTTDFSHPSPQVLRYSGSNLSSLAIFTIEAKFPKGIVVYPFLSRVTFFAQALSLKVWLSIGIILSLLSFLFYVYMLYLRGKDREFASLGYLDHPPYDLPPAVVGVLFRESASQREIAATILDLAQRGFVDIVKKREEYVLGKRQGKGTLRPFEALLYDKLFTQQGERKIKRTEFELEKRAAQQLYSPKITGFFQALYREAQKRGYFVKNPEMIILRYRVYGILFFFVAVAFAVLSALFSSGPPYAILGSFGVMVASFLIIKAAPLMPKRTKQGKEALLLWLAFGRFLSDKRPFLPSSSGQSLFEKYLPYAVVLGKEIDWASRFVHATYTPPDWYVANEEVTIDNFISSLFYITGSLSQALYELREPSL